MLSRSNIAYNLYTTPHTLGLSYEGQEVIFHFSSELYRKKFQARLIEHRESINNSLSKRFGVKVVNPLLADLRLYSTIEKRGYLINVDGEYYECQEDITLNGAKVI